MRDEMIRALIGEIEAPTMDVLIPEPILEDTCWTTRETINVQVVTHPLANVASRERGIYIYT